MPELPGGLTAGPGPDLRALLLAGAGWAGALLAVGPPGWVLPACLVAGAGAVLARRARGRSAMVLVAGLLVAGVVGAGASARSTAVRDSPVAELAGQGAVVTVTGRVWGDPLLRTGRFGAYTLTRLVVSDVVGRGRRVGTRVLVLVIGDRDWVRVRLGSEVQVTGRLGPATGRDLAGVLSTGRSPRVLSPAADLLDGAAAVRAGIRAAVDEAPPLGRTLVPALVVGDDQQLPQRVVADFRTCGLTHLAAVSGTNLTLVVGFALLLARWAGVRGRGLTVVGAAAVVGFVLLARPEPSVLRAAAMGSVALLGLGSRGRDPGVRALGAAVLGLLLIDPWLARSVGFALSALATAGILLLGPPLRDSLAGWLPRWAAEAVAVPLAAQLACTPLVAALSGQVSLVAVAANLAAAPAVAPATVLGLLGGVAVLVLPPVGQALGYLASLSAAWIVVVATQLARLPTPALDWSTSLLGVLLLGVACAVLAPLAAVLLRRPGWAVATTVLLVAVMVRPPPSPGWPPPGWVLVACDVGQGDGLVLNAAPGEVLVVDAGPDPRLMDRCLDRLGVRRVAVVVLTHFHADHVGGLPGVLAGRRVGEVDVTGVEVPAAGAAAVRRWARAAAVPVRVPSYGEVRRRGPLTWQVVGPRATSRPADRWGESGSVANDASLALLVKVRGVRLLLPGDMEPPTQRDLARTVPGLRADVLKVPHHGSRYQDPSWLAGLGARLAVVSVGRDNDYGHPADSTLAVLARAGARVERTDRDGDVAVTVTAGRLGFRHRGRRGAQAP